MTSKRTQRWTTRGMAIALVGATMMLAAGCIEDPPPAQTWISSGDCFQASIYDDLGDEWIPDVDFRFTGPNAANNFVQYRIGDELCDGVPTGESTTLVRANNEAQAMAECTARLGDDPFDLWQIDDFMDTMSAEEGVEFRIVPTIPSNTWICLTDELEAGI